MKVDGFAFIAARKKIRARYPGRGEPGHPAIGTQEWLADEAKLSLRAVQYLEKGEASLKTIKAASKLLDIPKWEEHICNYGSEYVTCTTQKVVDFRPSLYPPHYEDTFTKSTLTMSLDPLSILVEEGKFEEIQLKEVRAVLSGLDVKISFLWWAEVQLNPSGQGWLGFIDEIQELYIPANNKTLHISIMFRQENFPPVTWEEFVSMTEATTNSQLNVDVKLYFSNFEKHIKIYLSVELLQRLFAEGRIKYQSEWPYRSQLKAIT